MAGEWFAVDCCLETKPETVEILVATGEPVDVVIGRLVRLWAWAQLNSEDGSLKATTAILARVAGGDSKFWEIVAGTGWIEIGDKTITIAGWEKRFSQAAKRRMVDARRKADRRKADKIPQSVPPPSAVRPESVRTDADVSRTPGGLEEKRGEERKLHMPTTTSNGCTTKASSQPIAASASSDFVSDDPRECWEAFRDAWTACKRAAPLGTALNAIDPPRAYLDLWRAGDAKAALAAVGQLGECRFFEKPISLSQFLNVWPKIEAGGYRERKGSTSSKADDKPPPERWLDNYQPSNYRRPREVMELASKMKRAE